MAATVDLLIVGAGPVGCVIAEHGARLHGWHCLIVEKRNHIGGNCYDDYLDGVLIHRYGPHYFRTNNAALVEYLSRFTSWIPGNYISRSRVRGRLYPFPINLTTLQEFFGRELTTDSARVLLDELRDRTIVNPSNAEEFLLSRVGRELYEAFYLGYTLKQWERHPRDLDASVCGRIPIRVTTDERYIDHKFQIMPEHGFTHMFHRMISAPSIEVMLNTEYASIRWHVTPTIATVYTGPLDAYFDHRLGHLPWRSLHFEYETHEHEYVQPCAQINYPDEFAYTRTVEFKHITQQRCPRTVVSTEYPRASGEPFYPVPERQNRGIQQEYLALAEDECRAKRVYSVGRLARYTYINTDEAIEAAMATFHRIERDLATS